MFSNVIYRGKKCLEVLLGNCIEEDPHSVVTRSLTISAPKKEAFSATRAYLMSLENCLKIVLQYGKKANESDASNTCLS